MKSYVFIWNVTSTTTDQVSVLTYLWISPSIRPKLTLRVVWCFRQERGGGRRCCSPDWQPVFWVGLELIAWSIWKVCCLVGDSEGVGQSCVPVWGAVSWLDVLSCCGRSFFSWQDNWGLRRRTKVPPGQRTLDTKTGIIKLLIVGNNSLDGFFIPNLHFKNQILLLTNLNEIYLWITQCNLHFTQFRVFAKEQLDSWDKNSAQCTNTHRKNKQHFLIHWTFLTETMETDTQRHKPLHLGDDEWQVGSHVCFGAKLPSKRQVTDYSIYTGTGERQHCTQRRTDEPRGNLMYDSKAGFTLTAKSPITAETWASRIKTCNWKRCFISVHYGILCM